MEAENQIDLIYSEASDHDTECYQMMHGPWSLGRIDRLTSETREAFSERAMRVFDMLCELKNRLVGLPELPESAIGD